MSGTARDARLSAVLRRRWRPVTLGLALGAALMTLALWGVPLDQVGEALVSADPAWLAVPAALFLVQQTLRAWRQYLLLRAAHPEHRFRTSLSVLCISFLLINTLPARLGELSRPLLLLEREGIPTGSGFAMVFVERVLDLTSMLVMIALVAWLVDVPSHTLVVQGVEVDWVRLGRVAAGTAGPLLFLGLVGVLVAGRPLVTAARARLGGAPELVQRLGRPVLGFAEGFVGGIDAIRAPRRLAPVLALTALTWTLTGWMYPAMAAAFGLHGWLDFGQGIGVLSITMLGMAVPAAPGFAGTYEAFVRGALALFGVAGAEPATAGGPSLDAIAVAFALTMHWWIYLVQACTAVFFMAVDRVDVGRLMQRLGAELSGSDAAERAEG